MARGPPQDGWTGGILSFSSFNNLVRSVNCLGRALETLLGEGSSAKVPRFPGLTRLETGCLSKWHAMLLPAAQLKGDIPA